MQKILLILLFCSNFIQAHHQELSKAVKALDVKKVHELLISNQVNESDRLEALEQITEMIEKPSTLSRIVTIGQLASSSMLLWFAGRFIANTIKYNQDDQAFTDFAQQFWAGAPAKVLAYAHRNPLVFNTPLIAASGALFYNSAQSFLNAIKKLTGKDEKHMKAMAIQCMLSCA